MNPQVTNLRLEIFKNCLQKPSEFTGDIKCNDISLESAKKQQPSIGGSLINAAHVRYMT